MHPSVQDLLERLLAAAKEHGDDQGPDYEAGDLGELLEACFEVMTTSQVAAMLREPAVVDLFEVPEYEGIDFTPGG